MQQSTKHPTAGLIAVLQTILVFVVGVLGNKISEYLSISITNLLAFTGIGLGILAVISYFSIPPLASSVTTVASSSLKRFLPKTMVGIFPFGMFLGIVLGSLLPAMEISEPFINGPTWFAHLFNELGIAVPLGEFAGILGGCIACFLFALTIDGHLAGSLLFGYGLAFSTATIVRQTQELSTILLTYFGQGIIFVLIALFLIVIEPIFKKMRGSLTEPRI